MHLSDAISELGRHVGLPDLALNDSGLGRVVFDEFLTVDLESREDGRALHLSSSMKTLDLQQNHEAFLEGLLQANFLGTATGGAHFSLAPEGGEVVFERTLDLETLDFTEFVQAVESFVNHLEGWIANLETLGSESTLALGS